MLVSFIWSPWSLAAPVELAPACLHAAAVGAPRELSVPGDTREILPLPAAPTGVVAYAIYEDGVDVLVSALDAQGSLLAVADSPVGRDGVQLVAATVGRTGVRALRFDGKDPKSVRGRVRVTALAFAAGAQSAACERMSAQLLLADAAYGAAQSIILGKTSGAQGAATRQLLDSQQSYRRARLHARALGLQELAALELQLAALSYFGLDSWQTAADWAQAAQTNYRRAAQGYGAARAAALRAAAWLELATAAATDATALQMPRSSSQLLDGARALLSEQARYFANHGHVYQQALQLNNIGLSHFYQSEFAAAVPYYERARALFERVHDTQRVAVASQNIAISKWGLGRPAAALAPLRTAVNLLDAQRQPYLHLMAANNLGLASLAAGRYDEALDVLQRAYARAEQAQIETLRARALYGLAATQFALGDLDAARPLLHNVLKIWMPEVDARGRVTALRALASIESASGQPRVAVRHLREALALSAAPLSRGRIVAYLADVQASLGQTEQAQALLDSLLSPGAQVDPQLAAIARLVRGSMLRRQGQSQAAIADLTRALPVFRALQDLNAEFRCLLEMARAEQGVGRLQAARQLVDNALELSDEIRTQTANPEFRASLAATLRDALELRLQFDWQQYAAMQGGPNAAAARRVALESLALADSMRGQSLREWRATQRQAEDQLVQQSLQRLAGFRYQLAARNDRGGSDDRLAQNLRAEIQRERARLGVLQGQLRASVARPLRRAREASAELTRIARNRPKSAFIEYWVGQSSAFVWLIKGGQLHWSHWDRPQEIRRQSDAYRHAMVDTGKQDMRARKQTAAAVYDLILARIEPLLRNAPELVIVPDGPLTQISFATLLDRNQQKAPYLIQRHDLTIAPTLTGARARLVPRNRPVPAPRGMLLVADAVYGAKDPRLRGAARDNAARATEGDELKRRLGLGATSRLQRLVWSAREADGLARLLPMQQVTRLQGFDATRRRLLLQVLGDYRFLHMAVHAVVDPEIPQLSAVVLSRFDQSGRAVDAELRMADIANLGIDADLVVFSGCSSASGRSIVGEGVISLQYAALAGGARGVIATLWEVEDEITARLMTQTYKGIITGQEAPGRALGLAIRQLLAGAPELDPAAWGAFAYYSMLPEVQPAFNKQSGS